MTDDRLEVLRAGAVAPFTGIRWTLPDASRPGAWIEAGMRPSGPHRRND